MPIAVSLVEDNKIFRSSLVQLVQSFDGMLLVSAYANAEEAMNLLNDKPDIVIMDIELPGINGIELIRQLKPQNEDVQYLVCSSYHDDEKIFSALEAGASGYILKDCTISEIADAIELLHQGGSPMNAAIARRVIASFQKKNIATTYHLTAREKEILELLAEGRLYKEIARQLDIGIETVKKHVKHIYQKMHVENKIEAINKFNKR